MALSLQITSSISKELIGQIVQMDHDAYPPEDQMTWERAEWIYGLVGDSLILLREDGRMIGFLSIYGVRQDLVPLAIASQKPIFEVESPEHLIPEITGPADGYIHNIILNPEYRGRGYRRYLYLGLKHWLDKHPGIGYLWADAVSVHGQRALKGLGMEPSPALPRLWGGDTQSVLEALDRQLDKGGDWQDVILEG